MLTIILPVEEGYDENTNRFFDYPEVKLELEHSLISISKWEAKWHKPFISKDAKTPEEILDYIRCMTLNKNVPVNSYYRLKTKDFEAIQKYLDDPMTATWFSDNKKSHNHDVITSEIIYYWMTALNIPFEPCEKWHLNRLMTFIRVCNEKNAPQKNMSMNDIYRQNRELNAIRRAAAKNRR